MGAWDTYETGLSVRGTTLRNVQLLREQEYLTRKLPNNLSYHTALIDDISRNVAIINTDNLDTKYIYSMPGEDLHHGGLVQWMNSYWLITEKDFNTEVYTRAKMLQCNYLLKWVDDEDRSIHEQWCIIEDGTKYLTGEFEDRDFIVTRGDSRIAMTIGKNELTTKFDRQYRFLIDDPASEHMLAYALTKPMKLGHQFNGDGVFKFVLQEVNTTDYDNQELCIADYYKYFPTPIDTEIDPENNVTEDGREIWL